MQTLLLLTCDEKSEKKNNKLKLLYMLDPHHHFTYVHLLPPSLFFLLLFCIIIIIRVRSVSTFLRTLVDIPSCLQVIRCRVWVGGRTTGSPCSSSSFSLTRPRRELVYAHHFYTYHRHQVVSFSLSLSLNAFGSVCIYIFAVIVVSSSLIRCSTPVHPHELYGAHILR